ncbi:MAG TPA: helicase-associated domain-containing protein, partial [Anaerolineae bacterium]
DDLIAVVPVVENGHRAAPSVPEPLLPDQAPSQVTRAFNSLAIDAVTLLAALSETPLRVDAGDGWRPADEARLREMLLSPDPVRFALLMVLARDFSWLVHGQGRLEVENEAVGAWLRDPPWAQRTRLFDAWRTSVAWNDLRRMPSLRAEGEWRNDPLAARRAVLAALARLEPGAWYAIADVVAWLKTNDPDFQRPDGNYGGWYLRDVATGRYLSGFESWDEVEGRLIYFMISEPLLWLAALELGVSSEGHREAFRLTPAGAAWIAGRPAPELPGPARLQVNDDFTVAAPLALSLVERYRLLRFTEPQPEPATAGQPTQHRITRRSLARARANGLDAEKILQFLRHAGGGRVPPRLESGLRRWEQHGGSIRVTRGAVLRVEDANVLANLRADQVIGPLLGDLISAQAVVVSTTALPRLLVALKELGYSAQVDG